jgi:cobalt/nickel transport system ATP-binding protein
VVLNCRGKVFPRSDKIGIVFQDADEQLFMPTILKDVMFGLLNLGWHETEARSRAQDILQQVGIESGLFR